MSPIGPERADWRAALIAAAAANPWRGKGRALMPEDFMPHFGIEPKRRKSPKEIEMMMTSWAMGHNRRMKQKRLRIEAAKGKAWQR